MKSSAVSDSGPLIAFAVSGQISLFKEVFWKILIPVAVLEELRLDTGLPGGSVLAKIIYQDKWIEVSQFTPLKSVIPDILDPGESSGYYFSEEIKKRILLLSGE